MNLFVSPSANPYWNLATEEYLLKNSGEDFIFLYVNQPCVVVGKHQNTLKEIDSHFTEKYNILISRRLSGGGAVYHDQGNLNFSFIQTLPFGENISYPRITHPIFDYLQTEVAPTLILNERNDFMLDENKISGSAMHVYKNRVLAHGTLLIDCDLKQLSASLQGKPDHYSDKAIASKRAKVKNLSSSANPLTTQKVINGFTSYLHKRIGLLKNLELDNLALEKIQILTSEKFGNPDWIYGYSPKYQFSNSIHIEGTIIPFDLAIAKGVIENVRINVKLEVEPPIIHELNTLIGKKHNLKYLLNWNNSSPGFQINPIIIDAIF